MKQNTKLKLNMTLHTTSILTKAKYFREYRKSYLSYCIRHFISRIYSSIEFVKLHT